MLQCLHGQTTKNRSATGGICTAGRAANSEHSGTSASFGGVTARGAKCHSGADGARVGCWTSNCAATPVCFSSAMPGPRQWWSKGLGREAPYVDELRRGGGVSSALGRASAGRRSLSVITDSGGASATLGAEGGSLSRIPIFGATWVAQGGTGHPSSQERPADSRGLEKKLPQDLAALLKPEVVGARATRIMFQDEARFGRMVRIRRCWAPMPERPKVDNGYERQFVYVYGAVSPLQGQLDWMISSKMDTEQMNRFLGQVSKAHKDEFIAMVVDGASSHRSKDLQIPENIRLHRLPGYSPELNPQEHVWDELREKEFPNRVFETMEGVIGQLEAGLPRLAANTQALRSLTAWPWIVSLNLKAN